MTKAFVKPINKNTEDSHQISPHWLVTFIRFANRDTKNYKNFEQERENRKPFVVENDCISLSVSYSKTNNTPNATMTFLGGDINYSTAIAPGDFVIINMVNSSQKARELRDRVAGNSVKNINRAGDGFKGVFRVNSVNKIINVDPGSGQKMLRYQVTAYGFTEFNTSIYYNPTLGGALEQVFNYSLNSELSEILGSKAEIQKILRILPNLILGNGRSNIGKDKVFVSKKEPFKIPKDVFKLLGIKPSKGDTAVDLYKIMIGVWGKTKANANSIAEGFNPESTPDGSNQLLGELSGKIPIQTSSLVNVRLIDLIKRFSNDLINEVFSCYRIDRDTGLVLPKLIIRQKPFNTLHGKLKGTNFLELPRWKISPDLIYSLNVSRNDSLRFNFVHIIGTTGRKNTDDKLVAYENGKGEDGNGTVKFDDTDIQRHGLRPYTKVSNFDWPTTGKDGKSQNVNSPYWASLVFDWVYGGHLKLNGTLSCVGIEDDICIGDNLELQDTVYHIESIVHIGSISPDGRKSFQTQLTLTHGVDKRSSDAGPVYPEMDFTDTYTDRINDYESGYDILPGFSDTQDIRGRFEGEEADKKGNAKETKEQSFTPSGIKQKTPKNTNKED